MIKEKIYVEDIEDELKTNSRAIAEHLHKGNNINLNLTPGGLKIQSMVATTLNKKRGK